MDNFRSTEHTSARTHRLAAEEGTARRSEAGFTLVEVMVVLLILGILLGVALPTFVGARSRTADAAAFARLKAAADTAYALSEFGTDFTRATPDALELAEPWLGYTKGSQPSSDPDVITVTTALPTEWVAVVLSGSGQCFGVVLTANGREYYESASCTGASSSTALTGPTR